MSKTKELVIFIVPGVGAGLLTLLALGVLPAACLPSAAATAIVLLGPIAMGAKVVDAARVRRKMRPAA